MSLLIGPHRYRRRGRLPEQARHAGQDTFVSGAHQSSAGGGISVSTMGGSANLDALHGSADGVRKRERTGRDSGRRG